MACKPVAGNQNQYTIDGLPNGQPCVIVSQRGGPLDDSIPNLSDILTFFVPIILIVLVLSFILYKILKRRSKNK